MNGIVRDAIADDSDAILAIYAYYIENTAATFEEEVPSRADFRARVEGILPTYPYVVYEEGGVVRGYAYASKNRERVAYRYNVDVSVYVDKDAAGRGIGLALYEALFARLADTQYVNAYAVIVLPNDASIRLHERFGFTSVGTLRRTGYKFGAWHDVIWMEKRLRHSIAPPNPNEA